MKCRVKRNWAQRDKLAKLWCGMINHLSAEETKAFQPEPFFYASYFFEVFSSSYKSIHPHWVWGLSASPQTLKCRLRKCVDKPSSLPFSPLRQMLQCCQRNIYTTTSRIRFDFDTVVNFTWLPQLVIAGFPALGSVWVLKLLPLLFSMHGWYWTHHTNIIYIYFAFTGWSKQEDKRQKKTWHWFTPISVKQRQTKISSQPFDYASQ